MNYFPLINYQYLVKKDDTLEGLASRFNLRVETLKKVNPIIKDVVLEGQIINIPLKKAIVNKINQISYSISFTRHEYEMKVYSLFLSNHLYRTLLIKDFSNEVFNQTYYFHYISLKDELSSLLPAFLFTEFNFKYYIGRLLELWIELIRGHIFKVEDNHIIDKLCFCFSFMGEDYVIRMNKLFSEYQILVLNHAKSIIFNEIKSELNFNNMVVELMKSIACLFSEICE